MWAAARGIAKMDREMREGQWLREVRHAVDRQDLRADRLRGASPRKSPASRSQWHARTCLEQVAEENFLASISWDIDALLAKATSSRCICC